MTPTSQFTPVTPTALFPWAPTVPATWVPWPCGSVGMASSSMPRTSSTCPFASLSSPSASPGFDQMLPEVRMRVGDAGVDHGHRDRGAARRDLPGLRHVHVRVVCRVQAPELVELRIVRRRRDPVHVVRLHVQDAGLALELGGDRGERHLIETDELQAGARRLCFLAASCRLSMRRRASWRGRA